MNFSSRATFSSFALSSGQRVYPWTCIMLCFALATSVAPWLRSRDGRRG